MKSSLADTSRMDPCLEVNLPQIDGFWQPPGRTPGGWPRGQANAAPRAGKYHDWCHRDTPFDPGRLDGDVARVSDGPGDRYVFIVYVWRTTEFFVRRIVVGQSKQAGVRTYFGHKTLLLIQRRKSRRAIGFEETGNVRY